MSGFFYLRAKKMVREKTLQITGASSGIGRALAIQLASENNLILSSRNLDKLEATKSKCASSKIHLEPLDLEDIDSHYSIVARVIKNHGAIDHFIHCGGISQRSLVKDTLLSVDQNKTLKRITQIQSKIPAGHRDKTSLPIGLIQHVEGTKLKVKIRK